MRRNGFALVVLIGMAALSRAADLRNLPDAALHAVQFVDKNEGWAVGDAGAIWHTIDSGRNWDRQPTGVQASLRGLHFVNPFTGWAVGREELPHGSGSAGVILFTRDGGLKWRQASINALPGLNVVRFFDNQNGYVAGDGSDQCPSGLFVTNDTGRIWKPASGKRVPAWLAADWQDLSNGVAVGAWGRLATLRDGVAGLANMDTIGFRAVRGVRYTRDGAVAVGQGGLVLLSSDAARSTWRFAPIALSADLRAAWDFHAVATIDTHIWAAGRPGSAVLHSADAGKTWEIQRTGQAVPIHGLHFADVKRGWAVGELGTILATIDGGKSWLVQKRGGQRAAVLFVHAGPAGVPMDTVAMLGGEDSYLTAAVQVLSPDSTAAAPSKATGEQRLAATVRQVGGAAGEALWQFPVAQHQDRIERADLLRSWDRIHDDRGAEQLLRQLVLAVRVWRPNVIVTDHPDVQKTGAPTEALIAEAVHEAYTQAADPKLFPEQIEQLGLESWKADKLYARWHGQANAQVAIDLMTPRPRLEANLRNMATDVAGIVLDEPLLPPSLRFYRLLAARLDGANGHQDLMQGINLAEGGTARRELIALTEPNEDVLRGLRVRRNLESLVELPDSVLTDSGRVLAQLRPLLAAMPEEQAAQTTFAVAGQFAHHGQWQLAKETYRLVIDRYPAHPLAVGAARWLLRYGASSEARRRYELRERRTITDVSYHGNPDGKKYDAPVPTPPPPKEASTKKKEPKSGGETKRAPIGYVQSVKDPALDVHQREQVNILASDESVRRWYQAGLDMEKQIAAFGPLYANHPADLLCIHAAHRSLGDFETAQKWYASFAASQADGPMKAAAAAESWLVNRGGLPPKLAAQCRLTATRPHLDGLLDDDCWQGLTPLILKNSTGTTDKEYPTEALLTYDREYLYLALRCRHPADQHVAPEKNRARDADVQRFDHVDLLLDLDRDYATYFRLQVDQRGCLREDCWGDASWDPRWFVAIHSEPTCWQIEAAIPLFELTGEKIAPGRAWACNIVRVLPGRGVQAWSTPADVEPRPEGMGLLMFTRDTRSNSDLQAGDGKSKAKKATPPNAN